jgi:hypothetical protein
VAQAEGRRREDAGSGGKAATAAVRWAESVQTVVTPADKRNVTTRRSILIAAVTILATVANLTAQRPPARTAAVGVLVGVHRTDISRTVATAPRASMLRTLWLESTGRAVDAVSGLLVPRHSGFCRVDLDSNCAEEPHGTSTATGSATRWRSRTNCEPTQSRRPNG